jgi:fructose-bisphosphate aldolase class 1
MNTQEITNTARTLEGMILKPNMVLPGLTCSRQDAVDEMAAQQALIHRARCNSAARRGEYNTVMERKGA